ncbi:MAG TPA: acyl-ACP--UDP-N-acetylglucosamine O-acyltransferase [Planctomycetota bacterium]
MTASEPAPPPAPPVVHPTAVVMPGAELGAGVEVGPYAVLEPGVEVGAGSRIAAHAQLLGRTVLGARCVVGPGTVLGGVPQDAKYAGERTLVRIGADCVFHEHATVHRATGEGGETVLGAGVRLMVGAHVGHNCTVGDGAILVNGAALGGHVVVGAGAFLSQTSGVHQFGRVGRLTLVGGATMLTRDAPPFSVVVGSYPPRWRAPNTIGLRRAGFLPAQRDAIRTALRALFAPGANPRQVAEQYANHADPNLAELAAFVLAGRRQLVAPPARDPADEADAD